MVGYHYDIGDAVEVDKNKALNLFKRAALKRHAHSQWIHGTALLYGAHGIKPDQSKGIEFILAAANAKFQCALETLAEFYESGKFGFPVDAEKAKSLREAAQGENVIGY